MKFFTHIFKNAPTYLLGSLAVFLFGYHVDYSTLGSWDEAWYGSIAREMVRSGEWLRMNWNGQPFADHPPMGMWLIAISYTLFGVSELSTRLPSVLAGIGTTILMYRTGLFLSGSRIAGWVAALVMMTCVWYVIRVRSGNLDALFAFFYIVTIYASLKSRHHVQWFPFVGVLFGFLILTKTLVGVSAVPLIVLTNWQHILRLRRTFFWLLGGVIASLLVIIPWYYVNWHWYPDFYSHHFITIGTRGKTADSYLHLNYELPLFYLHMGVRKWYWVWVASVIYLLAAFRFLKREIAFVLIWNGLVLYPFLTTDQTHIWHLIPVYIPLSLVIALAGHDASIIAYRIVQCVIKKWVSLPHKISMYSHKVLLTLLVLVFTFLAAWQGKIFYHEVFPSSRSVPDDVDIARKAAKYSQTLYFDDDYLPIAVFYSGRYMKQMAYEPEERKTLLNLFQSGESDYIVITRNWALNNLKEKGIAYQVLEQNNSFSLVTKKDGR